MTKTALIIPAVGLPHLATVPESDRGSYDFIKDAINGFFDCVRSDDGRFHAYVDDEGLLKGLPINAIATALFGRILTGPCVVFGTLNQDGENDGCEHSVTGEAIRSVEYLAGAYKMWMESVETLVD